MSFAPLAISTFAIVLIVVGVVIAVLILVGLLGVRARDRRQADSWEQAVKAALDSGRLKGHEKLRAEVRLTLPEAGLDTVIDGEIELA